MSTDPYKYFRIEAREMVERLSHGALDLEKGRGDKDLIARLLRYAHTLKGAARVVSQGRIAEISHAIEETLAPYREDPTRISSSDIAQLLSQIDAMAALLPALDSTPIPKASEVSKTSEVCARGTEGPPAAPAEPSEDRFEYIRVDVSEIDDLLRRIADLRVHLSSLGRQVKAVEHVSQLSSGLVAQQREESKAGALRRIDHQVSAGPEEIDNSLRTVHRALAASLDRTERELGRVYEQASEMRLVPVSSIFGVLERSVRDASETLGKRAEFVATGGDTRLGAHALGLLRNALIHLVRNAVAHGIENADQRVAAGKDPTGRVELRVQRRGDQAVFTCSDDGRGIELDRARQVLSARGLVTPAEARELTPDAAMGMLLRGGISTKQRITELSGRGIGLDVVRETVAMLKGSTSAKTEPRRGTAIEISVPVSIESIQVLHVEVGGDAIAVPFQAVRRVMRLADSDVASSASGEAVVCDGQVVPLAPLAGFLHRESSVVARGRRANAVVLDTGAGAMAVRVDRLLGRERVVVHCLPEMLGPVPGVLGAFLDGEGDPRLVLDPAGLLPMAYAGAQAAPPAAPSVKPPLLVIDDSLTTRMLEQGILEAAGYDVDTAASGEEALQKAHRRSYGAFIVDVEMPGMDGFQFIEAAQADFRLSRVPSIVVTSRDSDRDHARGDRLGTKAYIVKSRFDEKVLLQTIREIVG